MFVFDRVNVYFCNFRRNAVPSVKIDPMDLFDYDSDSDKLSDILEDDLERGSAVLAAFVVAFITISFFGTLVAMISVTMSVSGDYQAKNLITKKTSIFKYLFCREELLHLIFANSFLLGVIWN